MLKRFKKFVKNQKGLTLVELLAVVVILGIIGAIAVPSIGNIIENSKKDAHVSNAQMVLSAARLAKTSNVAITNSNYTLTELVDSGYLEGVPENPYKSHPAYDPENSLVLITTDATTKKVTFTLTLKSLPVTSGQANTSKDYILSKTSNQINREAITINE